MKRLFMIILAAVVALAMVGCGGAPEASESVSAEPTQAASAEPTETPTPEPTEEPTETPEPMPDAYALDATGNLDGMEYKYNSAWITQPSTLTNGADQLSYVPDLGEASAVAISLSALGGENNPDIGNVVQSLTDQVDDPEKATLLEDLFATGHSTFAEEATFTSEAVQPVPSGAAAAWRFSLTQDGKTTQGITAYAGAYIYEIMLVETKEGGSPDFMATWDEMIESLSFAPSESSSADDSEQSAAASAGTSAGDVTTGMRNALSTAETYVRNMPFSDSGLRNQLEYEGYAPEEIEYAMANITVDWNAQAAKQAQNYLDSMSFSRQGLVDQLVYEGYTPEQAEYGVSQVYD